MNRHSTQHSLGVAVAKGRSMSFGSYEHWASESNCSRLRIGGEREVAEGSGTRPADAQATATAIAWGPTGGGWMRCCDATAAEAAGPRPHPQPWAATRLCDGDPVRDTRHAAHR